MKLATLAAIVVSASTAMAQAVEIPAMSVLTSTIVMNQVLPQNPAGNPAPGPVTTTRAALVAAGSNGGAPIAAVALTPNFAAAGLYNTNAELGRALALDGQGQMILVNPVTLVPESVPLAVFSAFDARFDLLVPSTEFGVAIGDWTGSMIIEFRDRATDALLASVTSSPYTSPDSKFFRSPVPFDRVVLRADSFDANWVIPQISFQTEDPWAPFGAGCAGTAGVPALSVVTPPRTGSVFSLRVSTMPAAGGIYVMVLGLSNVISTLGPLPLDLTALGMPTCTLYTDIVQFSPALQTGGTATYNLGIPNNAQFIGTTLYNQALVGDPTVNAFGAVMSNAGSGRIR